MSEPTSTIIFDGDSTGAVAALHAVDVEAKRLAATLKGASGQMGGSTDVPDTAPSVRRLSSLTEQVKRLSVEAAYGKDSVEAFNLKVTKAGGDPAAFRPLLDAYAGVKREIHEVLAAQQALTESERRQIAENDQWNGLRAQRVAENKRMELAAIKAVQDEQAHYEGLKNQWAAANQSRISKEDAALKAYATTVKNAAVEMQSVGLPASEKSLIRAREFGIPEAEAQKQYTYLKNLETQVAKTNSRYNEFGMTARGTNAALRTLPAQFTDIVVSLQGGQAPLTVLLQQGGQIKDSFGGAGNALKVMGQYVMGLINPISILAVTAGTLALAFFKGAGEAEAYNRAIITTGNASGATASRLSSMAQAVSDATGSTVGSIASAMTALVSAGNIAEAQFSRIAATATQFEKVAGVAVSETVKQFAELGKDPVKAIDKLNESHHFLTAEIYSQIKALQDQGDALGAGALAQKAWADALDERIPKLQENMGLLQKGWKGVMSAAKDAWDAMLGVGRGSTNAAMLSAAQDQYADSVNTTGKDSPASKNLAAQVEMYQRMIAGEGSMAAYQADRIKRDEAGIRVLQEADKFATKRVQMERELAKAQTDFNNSAKTPAMVEANEARIAGIRKKYAETAKGGGGRTPRDKALVDEAAKGVALYNDLISKGAGFTANYAEQMASLAKSASLGGLSVTQVAEAAALLNAQQPGTIALVKAENEAFEAALKTIDANDKLALSYEEARIAAASYIDTINKQAAREVAGAGRGAKFRENQQGLNAIEDKLTEKQGTLGGELRTGKIDKDQYDKYLALANDTYQKEVDAYGKSRAAMTEVQGSWALGAQEAMQNYADSSSDVFAQIDDLVGSSLNGMEDALVQFVTTGKLSFTDLANSIVSDITRIIIKQQISNAMGLGGSGSGGDFMGSIVSSALGSISGAFSNATGDFSAFAARAGGNGRAIGGPVSAGQMYRVNEKGPELLNVAGKQFLMMGSDSGKVTANAGSGSANTVSLVVNQYFAPNTSRATTMQAASDARRQLEYAGRNL